MTDRREIRDALSAAESALQAHEASIDHNALVARLRRVSPFHPALLLARGGVLVSATSLVGALGWMTLVALWADIPPWLATLADPSGALPLPLALALVAGIAALVATSAEAAAAEQGAVAPMTPEELQVHQRLLGEVLRLRALQNLHERAQHRGPRPSWAVA